MSSLKEIRERAEKATKGPWVKGTCPDYDVEEVEDTTIDLSGKLTSAQRENDRIKAKLSEAERERDDLASELALNASMLAEQCDLARVAEMEWMRFKKLWVESESKFHHVGGQKMLDRLNYLNEQEPKLIQRAEKAEAALKLVKEDNAQLLAQADAEAFQVSNLQAALKDMEQRYYDASARCDEIGEERDRVKGERDRYFCVLKGAEFEQIEKLKEKPIEFSLAVGKAASIAIKKIKSERDSLKEENERYHGAISLLEADNSRLRFDMEDIRKILKWLDERYDHAKMEVSHINDFTLIVDTKKFIKRMRETTQRIAELEKKDAPHE